MPHFAWAKIYCDLLRHPLLRDRPDSDVRLVLGLILEAKEHSEDGVIRNLTPQSARGLCHIKASVKTVEAGIDYLVAEDWMVPIGGGSYQIRDFKDRQGADSAASRMRQYRNRLRDETVTSRNRNVTETSPDTDTEVEKEEDLKALSTSLTLAPVVPLPPKPPSESERVFDHWRKVMRKPKAKLDKKREKLICARLAEGRSVEELCRAIDGYSRDPFSMGQNDRHKPFNDISLICRDAEHVEQFMTEQPASTAPAVRRKTDEEIAEEINREFEAKHGV